MKPLNLAWLGCLTALITGVSLAAYPLTGQPPAAAKHRAAGPVPRTPDGRPDLQGTWNFGTATPLERPAAIADKEFFTPEEAAKYVAELTARRAAAGLPAPGSVGSYDDFWFEWSDQVGGNRRTSLITDPRNGKMPTFTPEAEARRAAHVVKQKSPSGPEDFSLSDRCIVGINSGPPMLPGPYNNFVQLVQSREHVVIHNEMNHNARIVPLDGRRPLPATINRYNGYSRGNWEGDTLVVETSNFSTRPTSFGAAFSAGISERLNLIERFTRTDAATLLYEFTVDDPLTWSRSWSGELRMAKTDERIFEYACHEGNYALSNMLSGARAAERSIPDAAKRNR